MTEFILPKKIVSVKGAKGEKKLLARKARQIGLDETSVTAFGAGSYVILDFAAELCGEIRILTYISDNTPVRIRFGESISECCAELGGDKNATNDHSPRDFSVTLPKYSDLTFGGTGFRFVRLDFEGEVSIKSVIAINHILKKKALYTYEGNDERIREIFDAAKRTVDLCASGEYLWDGVKRDRLVWIGDIHPEMLALTALYGRVSVIERSLDFVKKQTPLPQWMNRFPMYSMWWIIIVSDYLKYTGAVDFASRQLDYLEGLVGQMLGCVSETGELNYPSYFVDWPSHDTPDEIHGVRAINIMAAKCAIHLLESFGKDATNAKELLRRLMLKKIAPKSAKQIFALKHFAVGLDKPDCEKLTVGGAMGMSTFMSYYILKAVASFDRSAAIDMMKEYYGAMLDKGATTFFEDFDMSWVKNSSRIDEMPREGERDIHGDFGAYCYRGFRHSLCHGWSAGVIRFIMEEC